MFELTGKTALITGASGAIGGGIARVLHAQGATLTLSGTKRDALDALAAALGERAHVLTCNLADPAETDGLVARAEEAMGQLDILVANAGVTAFYEVGSGKVLTGLIKRIAETAAAASIGKPEDVARFKAARA